MTHLPSLIKKIDSYYSLGESFERLKRMAQNWKTYVSPDLGDEGPEDISEPSDKGGPRLYPDVIQTINQLSNETNDFKNEDIANELLLIAELYKMAVEIHGGYHAMQEYIKRAMANIDMMIDESDGSIGEDVRDIADEVLEQLSADVRRLSKTDFSQQMDDVEAGKRLKSVKDNFNRQEAREEMESQKSVYEKGKPGEETGHGISARPAPETPEKYNREIERLQNSLETETDPVNRKNIADLAKTLVELIRQMNITKSLADEVKVTPNDQEKVEAFNQATLRLEQLRKNRLTLRRILNEFLLKNDQKELEKQLIKARDPREQEWIQEKINLLNLRLNNKLLRKRDEIKARKTKINSMGIINERGDFEPLNWELSRDAITKAILAGKGKTISKSDYDRALTEQRGIGQGREIPKLPQERGGWRPVVQKDFSIFTFPALIKELRDRKNTAIDSARRYITTEKEGGKPQLKEDVKAISDAIRKRDNAAKYQAILNLKKKIEDSFKAQSPAFQSYRRSIKFLPIFNRLESNLISMKDWQSDNGRWEIKDITLAQNTISDIKKIIVQYAKYYQEEDRPQFTYDVKPRFDAVVKFLPKILHYLEQNVLKTQDHLSETDLKNASDIAPNARTFFLTTILEEKDFSKLGQEITDNKNEIDQATADKMANDIFNQLFDHELKKLLGSL